MSDQKKELPILFSTDMVKAILDGRKTVTRRVTRRVIGQQPEVFDKAGYPDFALSRPRYKKGDHLWVREAWWAVEVDEIGIQYLVYEDELEINSSGGRVPNPKKLRFLDRQDWKWGRHPSIHMLKKYARIWLEVLGVRAERLQEITPAECEKEGLNLTTHPNLICGKYTRILADYRQLWDSLYAKRGYGWDTNPCVWRYEFKVKR